MISEGFTGIIYTKKDSTFTLSGVKMESFKTMKPDLKSGFVQFN